MPSKGTANSMTPGNYLAKLVSLPELQLVSADGRSNPHWLHLHFRSVSTLRACPRCATLCTTTYDHRWVKVLDSPFRERKVSLRIHKKRYWCKTCKKPFMEVLHGIFRFARLTARIKRHILWACSRFQSLLGVSRAVGCSPTTVRRSFYSHLEIHKNAISVTDFQRRLGSMSITSD